MTAKYSTSRAHLNSREPQSQVYQPIMPSTPRLFRIDSQIHALCRDLSLASSLDHHFLAAKYDQLAELYVAKSAITRQSSDLHLARQAYDCAIEAGQTAINSAPSSYERGVRYCFQGKRLEDHFDKFDSETSLDAGINAYEHALQFLPAEAAALRVEAAVNRANLLSERFDKYNNEDDIDAAIESGRAALSIAGSRQRASICNDLGLHYQKRAAASSIPTEDLQRAVQYGIAACQDGRAADYRHRTLNLCVARKLLFRATGDIEQLVPANAELRGLLASAPADLRAQVLVRLAVVTLMLSSASGRRGVPLEAVQMAREGLSSARRDDVEDEREELVLLIASELAEVDRLGRGVGEIAAELRAGRDPILRA
ncbi:hypothetical protein BT63DRAFT_159869 [Microthyrium microscopicum]|uniref:TPR-like protein n=1 Tax=Microthyrium microscopicum TaxID=703497 RepID=A0A6A6UMQ0_9PEZI|nr:hypothetical protein BT63DRAFT_159869 [Microthyrium microscopicum]